MTTGASLYPGFALKDSSDEIRLLTLHPGNGNDHIHCSLQNVSLSRVSEAEALSYAWGDPPATHRIWVNDREFNVRSNLYNALQSLRSPESPRLLWIDALCIDQSNIAERNHQVQQMAQIFSTATSVIVWLGPAEEYTNLAFDFLKESYLGSATSRKRLMDDRRWHAIKNLCQNEYWRRVWIVQEICLGQNVVIVSGAFRIPWQYITALRKTRKHIWPQYHSDGERIFMRSLPAKIDQQKELRASQSCNLWTLMESFQDSLCQEFHDKVYGFLGLSTDCGSHGLVVDYTKSVNELHRDVVLRYRDLFCQNDENGNAPQLVSLSQFMHKLLNDSHSKEDDNKEIAAQLACGVNMLSVGSEQPSSEEELEITASEIYVISGFSEAQYDGIEDLYLLRDFLIGSTPYSHIGHWRNQIDPYLANVRTFDNAYAFIQLAGTSNSKPPHGPPLVRPQLFHAEQQRSWSSRAAKDVFGIAPPGTCIGDLVFTFMDSGSALVFSRYLPITSQPSTSNGELQDLGLPVEISSRHETVRRLVGTAHILEVPGQGTKDVLQLSSSKTFETIHHVSVQSKLDWDFVGDGRLYTDIRTLQRITSVWSIPEKPLFAQRTMELIPATSMASTPDMASARAEQLGRDLDLEQIRGDPSLRRYMIGPGYAPVENPASLGYLCCILQLFFILEPIKTTILAPLRDYNSPLPKALRDMFWHLQYRSLPASPLPLTEAFGWQKHQIHEAQDLFEFYRIFSERLETILGADITQCFKGFYRYTSHDPEITTASRLEHFYDFSVNPDKHYLLECMEDDMLHDQYLKATLRFTEPPDVLIIQMKFYKYSFKEDKMTTWDGHFEYPPEVDLSSVSEYRVQQSMYQLHAVCVLEDVKPIARYLLYLRPRLVDRWILFFKESVTYAKHTEVFEDNFRRPGYVMPQNAPLRTPYLLMYIKKSKLTTYLS